MIAMQYSLTLPADYDMAIIDRRIRDKGALLDGFPRLRFKAYLSARKQDAWRRLTDRPDVITSIGKREWAHIGQK